MLTKSPYFSDLIWRKMKEARECEEENKIKPTNVFLILRILLARRLNMVKLNHKTSLIECISILKIEV